MLLAAPAAADIPPADACMAADEGKACDNAGSNADQAGTCEADTCTRTTPDGPMTYDCFVCKPSASAGGGSANQGETKEKEDDGGCNAAAVPVGGLASVVTSLVALGLALARRRRASA